MSSDSPYRKWNCWDVHLTTKFHHAVGSATQWAIVGPWHFWRCAMAQTLGNRISVLEAQADNSDIRIAELEQDIRSLARRITVLEQQVNPMVNNRSLTATVQSLELVDMKKQLENVLRALNPLRATKHEPGRPTAPPPGWLHGELDRLSRLESDIEWLSQVVTGHKPPRTPPAPGAMPPGSPLPDGRGFDDSVQDVAAGEASQSQSSTTKKRRMLP